MPRTGRPGRTAGHPYGPGRVPGRVNYVPNMNEAQLASRVQSIIFGITKIGGKLLAYHTHDSRHSEAGFPDWTFVGWSVGRGGRVMFRELKTARGKVSPAQQAWFAMLRAAGADIEIWRPEDLRSGRIVAELAELAGLKIKEGEAPDGPHHHARSEG